MKNSAEFIRNAIESESEWLPHELRLWKDFFSKFSQQNFKSVMDVGSGFGKLTLFLIEQLGLKQEEIVGVEPNTDLLVAASNRTGLENITFINEKLANLDLQKLALVNKFDLIVANMVFHYFNDLEFEDLIRKALALLKNDGIIAFSIPHPALKSHNYNLGYQPSMLVSEIAPWREEVFYYHRSIQVIFNLFISIEMNSSQFDMVYMNEMGNPNGGGDRLFFAFQKKEVNSK